MGHIKSGDNIFYAMFIRAAQMASFLASAFVIVANVWMCIQLAPGVKDVRYTLIWANHNLQKVDSTMSIIVRIYNIALGFIIVTSLVDVHPFHLRNPITLDDSFNGSQTTHSFCLPTLALECFKCSLES